MQNSKLAGVAVTTALVVTGLVASPVTAGAATGKDQRTAAQDTASRDWVVLFERDASVADGTAAIRRAGGTVLRTNAALGTATVRASGGFAARVSADSAVVGAAQDRPIGTSPRSPRAKVEDVERMTAQRAAASGKKGGKAPAPGVPDAEPLAPLQWDMRMIDATPEGSYAVQRGDRRVTVGIMDTGVDGSHPDIAPNFSRALSRNFVTDMRDIDNGEDADGDGFGDEQCEFAGCKDPVDHDDNDHGTHVAGTIGSPINGQGIAGVAPEVTLVNVRAGQDSGYFFLQPTLDALTYAGDAGLDVVNMSFYIDPWLYNCRDNPADSPEAQLEQRTIIDATQRALDYAHQKGVTLIAAAGNGYTDLGNPVFDGSSPDYPAGAAYEREVDNTCLNLPTEGEHVISVTSLGPSARKAYYSDYGIEQADVSAPGGDYYDGTPGPTNMILAPYPKARAIANGDVNPDGSSNSPFVVEDQGAYYQYLQGTSMAAPHAAGVAALIVSQYGTKDGKHKGGLRMNPVQTEKVLLATATDTSCPQPRTVDYAPLPDRFDATCEGSADRNGFYGDGVVNALSAVTRRR